jgi:hypothetical protein
MHARHLLMRVIPAAAITAVALAATGITASAHKVFSAGSYRIAIGWSDEPASGTVTYIDQPNAIQVFVDQLAGSAQTPVSDLNQDCTKPDIQVTVTFASVTSSPLCPAPAYDPDSARGRQDEYDAPLTPTRVGNYTFHIYGSIHGTAVDQTISSGPDTFDSVGEQPASAQFPVAVPAIGDLSTRIDQIDARAAQAASSASSAGGPAIVLSVIALIVAVAGSGGALAMAMRRRNA